MTRRDLFKLFALAPLAPLALKIKAEPAPTVEKISTAPPAPLPKPVFKGKCGVFRRQLFHDINGFVVGEAIYGADCDIPMPHFHDADGRVTFPDGKLAIFFH